MKKKCPKCGLPHLPNPGLDEQSDVIEVEVQAYTVAIAARPTHAIRAALAVQNTHDGKVLSPFTALRTLRAGNSWVVDVKAFPEVNQLLMDLGEKFDFTGSLNVQLMVGPKGPMPFEFNCRFSGTTAVRAYYGFNEPEMAIRSYLLQEKLSNPTVRCGAAFRYL